MKQRVQFGEAEGIFSRRVQYVAPVFTTACVCCNAETHGRTRDYDPSTDKVRADVVPMPVCAPCHHHAFVAQTTVVLQTSLFMVAGIFGGMCIYYLGQRPHDTFLKWGIVACAIALALDLAWMFSHRRRAARARDEGHHPGLDFSVSHGRTWLDTENDALVDRLIANNPTAKVLPTPLFWRRANKRDAPSARVVK